MGKRFVKAELTKEASRGVRETRQVKGKKLSNGAVLVQVTALV